MPIEPGDSWFSPKCIEVQPRLQHGGGRALNGLGREDPCRTQSNSECRLVVVGSETAGDKLRRQKGNNPDRQLRSRSDG
jgi:hypothetical protein